MKKNILILVFLAFVLNILGQQAVMLPVGPLKFTSLTGEYRLEGLYRKKEYNYSSILEQQESTILTQSFLLNTRSYIWHPNFMIINADFEYSPGNNNDNYLVSPNFSETRTLKKMHLNSIFFQNKPVNFGLHADVNEFYQNRENITNIKTNSKQWGATLNSRKFIPISLNYNQGEWDQKETLTQRQDHTKFSTFEARATKSFSKRDKNEFIYTYNDFMREDLNFYRINNWYNRYSLINSIYFDDEQKYKFRSMINYMDQGGDQIYDRLQTQQSLLLDLPKRFRLTTTYKYYNINQNFQTTNRNSGIISLNHQLYESLNTTIFSEYHVTNHTVYLEHNSRSGINFVYNKKIPYGTLTLTYNYFLQLIDMKSESVTLNIINEQYVLNDAELVLLKHPYVDINSIVVRDETGTIIYQRDFDYILIENSNFIEIRRVPGGQIQNMQTIFIDYIATQPGNYKYNMHNNYFTASVSLFKRLVEVYYRRTTQNYFNIQQADFLTLNYLTHNVYGARTKIGLFNAGIEYDDYNSSIVPYYMWKYYAEFHVKIKSKFLLALITSKRDYYMENVNIIHKYNDVNLRLTYNLNHRSKILIQSGYRQQIGPQIDLDLFISRAEFTTLYRKLYLSFGAELYTRNYLNDKLNFSGVFIKLSRRFN